MAIMYTATNMGCPAPTNAAAISGAVPPKTAMTIWCAKPIPETRTEAGNSSAWIVG
ncbi:hypothetical protein StoSoilB19_16980 [Arthrobacter sp. StoSoilB19]|nr:hypothetical protein StoSoilB19_16980 [Arthrobacter sp. StoSoilB19]